MANNKITLITLNCQGLREATHRNVLFSWLNCCKFSIVCLQETHSTSELEFNTWVEQETVNSNNLGGYACVSSPGTARSSGVAILYRPQFKLGGCTRDESGRLVTCTFEWADYQFQVANVYGPNSKRAGGEFFESLYTVLDSDIPVMLCGDFNTVVDPFADRMGCNPSSYWAYNWSPSLSQLTKTYDLRDAWRSYHPTAREYTWRRPNSSQASRLDMIWIPSTLLDAVQNVTILPFLRSDHSYVWLELSLPSAVTRGKGYWKLNTSILSNADLQAKIRAFWSSWQEQKNSFYCLSTWWDAGKVRIRQLIQQFSRELARTRTTRIRSLESTLFHLHRRQQSGDAVEHLLDEAKGELTEIYKDISRGARIRAKIQWAEEGEASTSFFLGLERKVAQKRLFSKIKDKNGATVSTVPDISRVWCEFYRELFTAQRLDDRDQQFFLNALSRSLSSTDSDFCEGELTIEECSKALSAMANGKSPGLDGLPAEFYKCFWPLLQADYVAVMNSCYHRGRMALSQRSGVISLLYKKGDKLLTKNWRPITLLGVDYKIASKAIANRLLVVISDVVDPTQSCGVPGRSSMENSRLLHDIVLHANSTDRGAAVLSLDQEKAFDRVEWSFLQNILAAMNFGPSFQRWIRLFYTDIYSSVLVNGFVSDPFSVSRGVRQGCPLSPLLYVLVAETIASAIRQSPAIDGYHLPDGSRCKLCQYADDTTVVVSSDKSIQELFSLFRRYESASGARLNVEKCKGLLLGSWRTRTHLPVQLDWTNDAIVVLGSRLATDGKEDWSKSLDKLSNLTSSWSNRTLSLLGRTLVANTLGLSLFWYLAGFVYLPPDVALKINQTIYPFIWNKKRDPVRRSSLIQRPNQGGLGVTDVNAKVSSLLVMWIKRYLCTPRMPWSAFFEHHLRRAFPGLTIHEILLLPGATHRDLKELPPFYRSVLSSWFQFPRQLTNGTIEILTSRGSPIPITNFHTKWAYRILLSLRHVEHRCLAKYRDWGFDVDWKTVWSHMSLWRFTRAVRDTSWLIAHASLPTADRLARFGMRVDPSCHCGQPESQIHLFVYCPLAIEILQWFLTYLRRYLPAASPPSAAEILVGYSCHVTLPPVFSALLGVIRHQLWLARNSFRFDKVPPSGPEVIRKSKSSLRFLIRMQQRHCPKHLFVALWLAGGSMGHVSPDGEVIFDESLW